MSNELAMLELPSYLATVELDDATKALMGNGGGSFKSIGIDGGAFRLNVNGKEVTKIDDRALNVVIVGAGKVYKRFYASAYVQGQALTAPDCWSPDGEFPDAKAQSPQSKRCIDCPQAEKGSGQGEGKACKSRQRIAVALANDMRGDVMSVDLPGASVFGVGSPGKWPLQTYAKMVGSKGIPITAVVTEMRFDTDAKFPKLTFKPVRVMTADEHQTAIEQGQTEAAKRAIKNTVYESNGTKPVAGPRLSAPVTDVVVETISEPTKKVAKQEEAAPKKDLSKILAEWDDE